MNYMDLRKTLLNGLPMHKVRTTETKTMFCDTAEPDRIKMWKNQDLERKPVNKEKKNINQHKLTG